MIYEIVQETPTKLNQNEIVIKKPDFIEEVIATRAKRGIDQVATVRSIRDFFSVLAGKYDQGFNPYGLILQKYDNLPYSGDKGFSDLIMRIIKDNDLKFVEKAIELQLQKRKPIVDTIYYISPDVHGTAAFIKYGFHMKNGKNIKKNNQETENLV